MFIAYLALVTAESSAITGIGLFRSVQKPRFPELRSDLAFYFVHLHVQTLASAPPFFPNDRQPSFPTHLSVHISREELCRRPVSRLLQRSWLEELHPRLVESSSCWYRLRPFASSSADKTAGARSPSSRRKQLPTDLTTFFAAGVIPCAAACACLQDSLP